MPEKVKKTKGAKANSKKAGSPKVKPQPVVEEAKKVEVDGVVVENLQDTRYLVEIQLGEFKHRLEAYPGGKMRTYYRGRININDKVRIEIDPNYNIDIGRIVRKLPPKKFNNETTAA